MAEIKNNDYPLERNLPGTRMGDILLLLEVGGYCAIKKCDLQ